MLGPVSQALTASGSAEPRKVTLAAKKFNFGRLSCFRNAVVIGVKPMAPVAQKSSVVSALRRVAQVDYNGLDPVQNLGH